MMIKRLLFFLIIFLIGCASKQVQVREIDVVALSDIWLLNDELERGQGRFSQGGQDREELRFLPIAGKTVLTEAEILTACEVFWKLSSALSGYKIVETVRSTNEGKVYSEFLAIPDAMNVTSAMARISPDRADQSGRK